MALLGQSKPHHCAPPISPGHSLLCMDGGHITADRDEGKVWQCDDCGQRWHAQSRGRPPLNGTFWLPVSERRARQVLRRAGLV
jgi:ribosomal protein L37AE/L43A